MMKFHIVCRVATQLLTVSGEGFLKLKTSNPHKALGLLTAGLPSLGEIPSKLCNNKFANPLAG